MREIFAGLNSKAALPKLMETIDAWRPDLIVRDSVEFASAVAAERAGVPHARVAVHMVSFEEIIPRWRRSPSTSSGATPACRPTGPPSCARSRCSAPSRRRWTFRPTEAGSRPFAFA